MKTTNRFTYFLLAVLILASFTLGACAPVAPTQMSQQQLNIVVQTAIAMTAQAAQPTTASASPTPVSTPQATQGHIVTYSPPMNAFGLIDHGILTGVSYDLIQPGPYKVVTPAEATTTISGGNFKVDDQTYKSDGTEGNVVTIVCRQQTGSCDHQVTDYVQGNINVTTLFPGFEVPNLTTFNAVKLMFQGKNCGDHGCNKAYQYTWGNTVAGFASKTFTRDDQPTSPDQLGIDPLSTVDVAIAVVGGPSTKVIKVNDQIVGYNFVDSTADPHSFDHVGVTEGSVTIVACPEGCKIINKTFPSGSNIVLFGNTPDGTTPADNNWTQEIRGNNMNITLLTTLDYEGFLPSSYTAIYSDGTTKEFGQ